MEKLNLILCMILTLVIVTPALAAAGEEPVGELIDFGVAHQEFPANTPFHTQNGFVFAREMLKEWGFAPGDVGFALEIDNELIPESYRERFWVHEEGVFVVYTLITHNFPEGLPAGNYHFTGTWYVPCKVALEIGFTDECEYPNAEFEWEQMEMVVTFK